MGKRIALVAVWVIILGSLAAGVAFVIHITSVTQEGTRVVEGKAISTLHLNAEGHLAQGNGAQVAYSKSMKGWVGGILFRPGVMEVRGWAGDKVTGVPATTVVVLINGHYVAQGHTGRFRPDVARKFNHSNLKRSGFAVIVKPFDRSAAESSSAVMRVYALNADGEAHELEYTTDLPIKTP